MTKLEEVSLGSRGSAVREISPSRRGKNGRAEAGHGPKSGARRRTFPACAKRATDCVGTTVLFLVFGPLMLLIAVLIRLESSGPVFFRQQRLGLRGRSFWVLKFRTMFDGAEARLKELEARNESAGGVLFKMKRDPRVTRVGRILRRTSMDELPQFFNIFRGDMSLVGPRPLQLRDCDLLRAADPESFAKRLQVKPGLTGLWQVSGRSDLNYDDMVGLDLAYIDSWSLLRDYVILLKTVLVVLLGKGAY